MSIKIEKAAAEREALAGDTAAHLATLEAMVGRYRAENAVDPDTRRRELEPLANLARALRTEYAAYQGRFAALLDRAAVLDLDALENFRGFSQVSPLPAAARRITVAIAAALAELDDVLRQAEGVATGERQDARLWDIQETVTRLEEALWHLPGDIRLIMSRIGTFESAQPIPAGSAKPGRTLA